MRARCNARRLLEEGQGEVRGKVEHVVWRWAWRHGTIGRKLWERGVALVVS